MLLNLLILRNVYLLILGPSYVIDTACSSTMYAFSTALQSMRNGACDAAIVGGVNVDVIPDVALTFTQLGMTSPDGKCKHLDKDGKVLHQHDVIRPTCKFDIRLA